MGKRVTSRGRTRLTTYPWPVPSLKVANSQINGRWGIYLDGGLTSPGILGPFTMDAVMELIYRVKSVHYEAHGTNSYEGEDEARTHSGTMDIVNPYDLPLDEVDVFESVFLGGSFEMNGGSESNNAYFQPLNNFGSLWDEDRKHFGVLEDEDGYFWLSGTIAVDVANSLQFRIANHSYDGAVSSQMITANLALACGNFPIELMAYVSSGLSDSISGSSLDLTVTEWWPYATKDGADAWDTATGAPANGGPGA